MLPPNRPWSEEDQETLAGLFRAGMSHSRMALALDRTQSAVQWKCRRLGLVRPKAPGWSAEEDALVTEAAQALTTWEEVVKATGRTLSACQTRAWTLRMGGRDAVKARAKARRDNPQS